MFSFYFFSKADCLCDFLLAFVDTKRPILKGKNLLIEPNPILKPSKNENGRLAWPEVYPFN